MKLTKTLTMLTTFPILLTGCSTKVSKAEAIKHVESTYTSSEMLQATGHIVTTLKEGEAIPSEMSSSFESTDDYKTCDMYPVDKDLIEEFDENSASFYIDGKNLQINFDYKGEDVKQFVEFVLDVTFPADSKTTGTANGYTLYNEKGYQVKMELNFAFEVSYKKGDDKYIGNIKYTASATYTY